MGRKGQHINALLLDMNREMPYRMYCICMERHTNLTANPPDLGNGLDGSNLIVSVHDGYKASI